MFENDEIKNMDENEEITADKNEEIIADENEEITSDKKIHWKIFHFFVESDTVGKLIGKILLMFAIPYVYLILCGIIFDKLLKLYAMTTFIFYSLLALYVVAIVMIVIAVMRFIKAKKQGKE